MPRRCASSAPRTCASIGLHVLPNIASTLIVSMTITFPETILLEIGLSFLGLGVQPPLDHARQHGGLWPRVPDARAVDHAVAGRRDRAVDPVDSASSATGCAIVSTRRCADAAALGAQIFLLVETQISNAAANNSLGNLAPERQRPQIRRSRRAHYGQWPAFEARKQRLFPRPLPVIGVWRVIMQCRAHDDDRAAPAVAPGPEIPMASAFQPATAEQGCFSGDGYRWIRGLLARNPCAIGIQPVHTQWTLCGFPQSAIRRKATSR